MPHRAPGARPCVTRQPRPTAAEKRIFFCPKNSGACKASEIAAQFSTLGSVAAKQALTLAHTERVIVVLLGGACPSLRASAVWSNLSLAC